MVEVNQKNEIVAIKTRNNKKNKIKVYPIEKLKTRISLVKTLGVTLVGLRCQDFDKTKGCSIEIEYPSNIMAGSFKTFKAKLERQDDVWILTENQKHFTQMHLVAKKMMGLLIGIKKIDLR
jgi:hypothetical protein